MDNVSKLCEVKQKQQTCRCKKGEDKQNPDAGHIQIYLPCPSPAAHRNTLKLKAGLRQPAFRTIQEAPAVEIIEMDRRAAGGS
jgi:hypothetical protein